METTPVNETEHSPPPTVGYDMSHDNIQDTDERSPPLTAEYDTSIPPTSSVNDGGEYVTAHFG